MATYNVRIKKACIEELKSSEDFVLAIQLARIVNALRSNERSYINVSNNDRLLDTKDRLDLLLVHGSMLYEGIRVFARAGKRLSQLHYWKKNEQEIQTLTREYGNSESFANTVLKTVRNKIFFHFDKQIIAETLHKYDLASENSFAQGQSMKRKHLLYTVVDDLILTHLVRLYDLDGEPSQRYEEIEKKIIDLSDRLCSVCDYFLKELLHDKLDFFVEN